MKNAYALTEKKIAALKKKIEDHDEKISLMAKARKDLIRDLENLELSLLNSVLKDRGLGISDIISSLEEPSMKPVAPVATTAPASKPTVSFDGPVMP